MKHGNFVPRSFFGLGLVLGGLLAVPVCHAGDAVTLMPVDDADVPEGSQISEQRLKAIEKRVERYKKEIRTSATQQQQDRLPQAKSPKSKVIKPDG